MRHDEGDTATFRPRPITTSTDWRYDILLVLVPETQNSRNVSRFLLPKVTDTKLVACAWCADAQKFAVATKDVCAWLHERCYRMNRTTGSHVFILIENMALVMLWLQTLL